jgi:ESS family glutamate:Na+ symporter
MVSLIGGRGTSIAWAPRLTEDYAIENAMEIGIACATFGLILDSAMGGPIARLLISRHQLKPEKTEPLDVGLPRRNHPPSVTHLDVLDAVLAIHICIIIGLFLNESLEEPGLKLPTLVSCLFAGILVTNLIPTSLPRVSGHRWPSRNRPSL